MDHNPAAAPRVAFVRARWHHEIVDRALSAFTDELGKQTDEAATVDVVDVPGALELPLRAKRLARTGGYDAIVACALVVDGGIYRHEFVAGAVLDGLVAVGLETDTLVLSLVLTPHRFHAQDEAFFLEHFEVKGREAARACLEALAPATA